MSQTVMASTNLNFLTEAEKGEFGVAWGFRKSRRKQDRVEAPQQKKTVSFERSLSQKNEPFLSGQKNEPLLPGRIIGPFCPDTLYFRGYVARLLEIHLCGKPLFFQLGYYVFLLFPPWRFTKKCITAQSKNDRCFYQR